MTTKSETGKFGEDLACRYLMNKGYKVLERNYRKPWGEIDIIATAPDKTLVFVEVKTIVSHNVDKLLITPEDQLTGNKLRKLKRTAYLYANNSSDKIDDSVGWRIDLLALTIQETSKPTISKSNGLTTHRKDCLVKHYENIA